MKKAKLLAMGISAFIALTNNSVLAHEDHEHDKPTPPPAPKEEVKPSKPADGHGHSHATKIPETVAGIWELIHKQEAKLVDTVEKKKLGSAHDYAFTIRDLVKALPGKVTAENKSNAEEGAKEIAKLAADIDKSSAAGAQKATDANVKKMSAALAALEAKLKPVEVKK